jgi:hypothetical protein
VRRRELLGAGIVAAALAACSEVEAGSPSAEPLTPAVLPGQARHVLDEVDAALARAVPANNARLLGTRVTGPASREWKARLTVAAARKERLTAPSPVQVKRLVLPAVNPWPRWFLAAGTAAGQPTPVLRVFRSVTARDPYGLWGELSLLPGASLPDLASPLTGTPVIAPGDGKGLVAAPSAVVGAYAGALTAGSTAASQFAPDQFREQVAGQTAEDRRKLGGAEKLAEVGNQHRPSADGLVALRTQDGGALVVAALEQLYDVKVRAGAGSVTVIRPDVAVLAGTSSINHSLRRTSVETLAFRVPPAGGGAVTVIAAAKTDVSAVGS